MDVVVGKETLLDGLLRVSGVIPQKPTLPVISNFLVRARDNKLAISGTDMDISITTSIDCVMGAEGSITVNAKQFLGMVRELPSGDIGLIVEGETLKVTFASGQARIAGMPASDYPALKDSLDGTEVTISGFEFAEMVDKTSFSVGQDRTRLALTGIFLQVQSDGIIMVSTDGHRLSHYRRKTEVTAGETAQETEAIIPPKSLTLASQIISGGTEMKRLVFGERAVLFDFGTTTIYSKLIEGPYPNFRQVIPTTNSKKVRCGKDALATSLKRASVMADPLTRQVRVELAAGSLDISAKNDQLGAEFREKLPVGYEGDPLVAGYNVQFLIDIFRRIETDEALLEMETPVTACIVRPVGGKETDDLLYLIMPLRLAD